MDISKFKVDPDNQVADLEIVDPNTGLPLEDEEGNTLVISLYGPDSTNRERALDKHSKQISNVQGGDFKVGQAKGTMIELAVSATKDWQNMGWEGEEIECTPKNARMVYKNVPAIREQVVEFMNDRSNFLGND